MLSPGNITEPILGIEIYGAYGACTLRTLERLMYASSAWRSAYPRETYLVYFAPSEPLVDVVTHPLQVAPQEQRHDHKHHRYRNLPEQQVAVVVHRPHWVKVHTLKEVMSVKPATPGADL